MKAFIITALLASININAYTQPCGTCPLGGAYIYDRANGKLHPLIRPSPRFTWVYACFKGKAIPRATVYSILDGTVIDTTGVSLTILSAGDTVKYVWVEPELAPGARVACGSRLGVLVDGIDKLELRSHSPSPALKNLVQCHGRKRKKRKDLK